MLTDSEVAVAREGWGLGRGFLPLQRKRFDAAASRLTRIWLSVAWCSIFFVARCFAQDTRHVTQPRSDTGTTLRRGANEFGGSLGYSPFSFVLKGTSKDRQLLLASLQYARTLFVARPLTLKYTAEVVPLALEFQPTQIYLVDGQPLVSPSGTLRAAGANPIGFQANFGSRRIQPFGSGSLGFLYFNRQMPVIGSSQFNYNITIGFGVQFFARLGRSFSVGWKYHHLSNNDQAHFNPGLDSGVFYAGFSVFRTRSEPH